MTAVKILACAILSALPLIALEADPLFEENFDNLSLGSVAADTSSGFIGWQGPESGKYGSFEITDLFPGSQNLSANGDRLNVLAVHDISPAGNQAPTLVFPWKGKAPKSGHLLYSWDFQVPVEGPYLAVFFFGNHWLDSAAAIVLSDGNIILHADKGDVSRMVVGEIPSLWSTIKADLDIDARTIDLWIDGKKVAYRVPWLATAPKSIDRLSAVADLAPVDRKGDAVLYMDNIKVVAKGNK